MKETPEFKAGDKVAIFYPSGNAGPFFVTGYEERGEGFWLYKLRREDGFEALGEPCYVISWEEHESEQR